MRILVFGDSITQGFQDTERGGWCNRLAVEVMRRENESDYEYNRSVFNLGISGNTSDDVLMRVHNETLSRLSDLSTSTSDVVVLAIGVNDSQFLMDSGESQISVEKTLFNFSQIISKISDSINTFVIVGIAPVCDGRVQPMAWKTTHGYGNKVIADYNQSLRAFASKNNHIFIDMDHVFEGDAEQCLPDGIHPNAQGHELMFQRIKSAFEKEGIL